MGRRGAGVGSFCESIGAVVTLERTHWNTQSNKEEPAQLMEYGPSTPFELLPVPSTRPSLSAQTDVHYQNGWTMPSKVAPLFVGRYSHNVPPLPGSDPILIPSSFFGSDSGSVPSIFSGLAYPNR